MMHIIFGLLSIGSFFFLVREAFKNVLADFSVKGGGYPPIPLRVFGQNDFPLRGGGYLPIPLRKKSAKKQLLLAKKRQF